ncbi:5'-3' exonuclease H3TH domain-containing protein [Buchnera aphidicola]|uniref:5'-3' exonuclease n=1 Tax=Buchnera aphidicola TaxID=9 RepID=UPI0034649C75
MNKKKNIILIDAYSYLYRIFYAKLKQNNIKKQSLNIELSLLNILKKMMIEFNPKKLIIVFDTKGKNFRNTIFKKYKINRIKMPYALQCQIPKILQLLTNVGIPVISMPNFEADDIIGTLSKIAEKHGDHVLIGTCDKDLAQLVNKNIYILNNMTNTILKEQNIKIKYGVPPKLIIDLLSLTGDTADNIPGVKGIGKKIAIALLINIGNITKIYNNFEKIRKLPLRGTQNIINKLINGKKMAFLSYKLAKIQCEINIVKKYEELNFFIPNLKNINKEIKYKKIIQDIQNVILNNSS